MLTVSGQSFDALIYFVRPSVRYTARSRTQDVINRALRFLMSQATNSVCHCAALHRFRCTAEFWVVCYRQHSRNLTCPTSDNATRFDIADYMSSGYSEHQSNRPLWRKAGRGKGVPGSCRRWFILNDNQFSLFIICSSHFACHSREICGTPIRSMCKIYLLYFIDRLGLGKRPRYG